MLKQEPPALPAPFLLANHRIDPGVNEIDGQRIDSKSMDVLVCLAAAAPGLVTHAQLLERVWPTVVVGDNVLYQAIAHLRKVLRDDARAPRFIENVPRRGYRLLVDVRRDAGDLSASSGRPDEPLPTARPAARRWRPTSIGAAGLVALLLGILLWMTADVRPSADRPAAGVPERSIAVLPFVNISSDTAYEYFSNGLSEELIQALARHPDLKVISRTSAFSYKGHSADLRTIAERLGVAHVLEGSVRTSGDDVRVSVLLVDARTDTRLWSATYDRKLGDVLALQAEIADEIYGKLQVALRPLPDRPEVHPKAYLRYLEARHLLSLDQQEALPLAIALLDEALMIDGGFVRAWTERARASWSLGDLQEADRARLRAAELDPDDPVLNGFIGFDAFWQAPRHHDLAKAAAHYSRALQFDPANVDVLRPMTILLIRLGRLEEAVAVSNWLLSRDPLCVICRNNLGQAHLAAGRFAEADQAWRDALALAPSSVTARAYLAWSKLLQGEAQAALELAKNVPNFPAPVVQMIQALALHDLGESDAADRMIIDLETGGGNEYPYLPAIARAWTGDHDAAFAWLERAGESPVFDAAFPHLTGGLAALHTDPRWPATLERFGLSREQLKQVELAVTLPELEP